MSEYIIEKVSDFLKIPEDKIDVCLDEFKVGLKSTRPMIEILKHTAEALDVPLEALLPRMVWRDDGDKKFTFKVMPTK